MFEYGKSSFFPEAPPQGTQRPLTDRTNPVEEIFKREAHLRQQQEIRFIAPNTSPQQPCGAQILKFGPQNSNDHPSSERAQALTWHGRAELPPGTVVPCGSGDCEATLREKHGLSPHVRFPSSRVALWDPAPQGLPAHITHVSSIPSLVLLPTLVEAIRAALRNASWDDSIESVNTRKWRFNGHIRTSFPQLISNRCPGRIQVVLEDVHKDKGGAADSSYLENLSADECSVPVTVTRHEDQENSHASPGNEKRDQDHVTAQSRRIQQRLQSLQRVRPCGGNFAMVSIQCAASGRRPFELRADVVMPSESFTISPLKLLKVIPTSLSQALYERSAHCSEPTSGFLSMDQARRLLLLPELGPQARQMPLVGVWVSGVESASHSYLWEVLMRYVHSAPLGERVYSQDEAFLCLLYPRSALRHAPVLYQAAVHSGQGLYAHIASQPVVIPLSPSDGRREAPYSLEFDAVFGDLSSALPQPGPKALELDTPPAVSGSSPHSSAAAPPELPLCDRPIYAVSPDAHPDAPAAESQEAPSRCASPAPFDSTPAWFPSASSAMLYSSSGGTQAPPPALVPPAVNVAAPPPDLLVSAGLHEESVDIPRASPPRPTPQATTLQHEQALQQAAVLDRGAQWFGVGAQGDAEDSGDARGGGSWVSANTDARGASADSMASNAQLNAYLEPQAPARSPPKRERRREEAAKPHMGGSFLLTASVKHVSAGRHQTGHSPEMRGGGGRECGGHEEVAASHDARNGLHDMVIFKGYDDESEPNDADRGVRPEAAPNGREREDVPRGGADREGDGGEVLVLQRQLQEQQAQIQRLMGLAARLELRLEEGHSPARGAAAGGAEHSPAQGHEVATQLDPRNASLFKSSDDPCEQGGGPSPHGEKRAQPRMRADAAQLGTECEAQEWSKNGSKGARTSDRAPLAERHDNGNGVNAALIQDLARIHGKNHALNLTYPCVKHLVDKINPPPPRDTPLVQHNPEARQGQTGLHTGGRTQAKVEWCSRGRGEEHEEELAGVQLRGDSAGLASGRAGFEEDRPEVEGGTWGCGMLWPEEAGEDHGCAAEYSETDNSVDAEDAAPKAADRVTESARRGLPSGAAVSGVSAHSADSVSESAPASKEWQGMRSTGGGLEGGASMDTPGRNGTRQQGRLGVRDDAGQMEPNLETLTPSRRLSNTGSIASFTSGTGSVLWGGIDGGAGTLSAADESLVLDDIDRKYLSASLIAQIKAGA